MREGTLVEDEGSGGLSGLEVGMLAFLGLYVPVMFYLYGRQRRWSAALGWSMLVGGVVALGAGAGNAFAWGGLAFLSLAALGGLLVAMDIVGQRNDRIRRG